MPVNEVQYEKSSLKTGSKGLRVLPFLCAYCGLVLSGAACLDSGRMHPFGFLLEILSRVFLPGYHVRRNIWGALYTAPAVTLGEEGIAVRFWFRKRFYPWKEICQAGYLWSRGNIGYYSELVLLLPGGSPRRNRDKTFRLRNLGKIVRLPMDPEIVEYILAHYGLLDF